MTPFVAGLDVGCPDLLAVTGDGVKFVYIKMLNLKLIGLRLKVITIDLFLDKPLSVFQRFSLNDFAASALVRISHHEPAHHDTRSGISTPSQLSFSPVITAGDMPCDRANLTLPAGSDDSMSRKYKLFRPYSIGSPL